MSPDWKPRWYLFWDWAVSSAPICIPDLWLRTSKSHVFPILFWTVVVVATICCVVIREKVNHLLCALPVGASFLVVGSRSLHLNWEERALLSSYWNSFGFGAFIRGENFLCFSVEEQLLGRWLVFMVCSCFVYFDWKRQDTSISYYCCVESRVALSSACS